MQDKVLVKLDDYVAIWLDGHVVTGYVVYINEYGFFVYSQIRDSYNWVSHDSEYKLL